MDEVLKNENPPITAVPPQTFARQYLLHLNGTTSPHAKYYSIIPY